MQLFRFTCSQILDLSIFILLPFLLPKLLHSSLSVLLVSLFNCLHQRIAKSFTQKLPLGKGSGYTLPEHSLYLRNTWHLPSGGFHTFFWTYMCTYIYIREWELRFQWFISVGLVYILIGQKIFYYEAFLTNKFMGINSDIERKS